jgi:hypothetical protein
MNAACATHRRMSLMNRHISHPFFPTSPFSFGARPTVVHGTNRNLDMLPTAVYLLRCST